MDGYAILLANGSLDSENAKTSHGLIRGSERFKIVGVIDPKFAGQDAGTITDGTPRNIPIFSNVNEAIESNKNIIDFAIVGVATPGGVIPAQMLQDIKDCIQNGFSIVSGLHQYLADNEELVAIATTNDVKLIDIRKPKPASDLHFWSGKISSIKTPIVAVLGTDCAIGKRTTARFLRNEVRRNGMKSEMIYTGQTGWLQGNKYGFILDATLNDFVSGEMEHAILTCIEKESPDIIFIEGQSTLMNPSGPCGSELIISGNAKGVILQHAPARKFYNGWEEFALEIPPITKSIDLIRLYGAEVLGICLNTKGINYDTAKSIKQSMELKLQIPVFLPVEEGVGNIMPVIKYFHQKMAPADEN